jgi:ribonuclease III
MGLDTIGDAVLDFCILNHFYNRDILDPEYYNEKRERYGNNDILHEFSKKCIQLWSAVRWSSNEAGMRVWEIEGSRTLADCFEAVIGGLFIDGGAEAVERFLDAIDFYEQIDSLYAKK